MNDKQKTTSDRIPTATPRINHCMSDFRRKSIRLPQAGLCLALCAALLIDCGWCQPSAAGPIMIDNFTFPGEALILDPLKTMNPSKVATHTSGIILGGQGDVLVNVVGQSTKTSTVNYLGTETVQALNAIQIGTNGLAPSVTTLQYSGSNNLNTKTSLVNNHNLGGGAGIDLTGGGTNDRFKIVFISSDAQPSTGLDISVTVTSSNGLFSSTAAATAQNQLTTFAVNIPFSSLLGNAVLSQIDSVVFVFNGVKKTPQIDFEISQILAVPEPTGQLLLATACLALGLLARRARRRRRDAVPAAGPIAGYPSQ